MPAVDHEMISNMAIVKRLFPNCSMEQSDHHNCYMVTDPLRGYYGPSGRSIAHAWERTANELTGKENG
jgi:hypothetical protein